MVNWKRNIEYSLYDSSVYSKSNLDIRQERAIKKEDMHITYAKLCVATSKAMLTNAHVFSPYIVNFARSYFHIIPFLLTEKNGYLAFDYNNKDVLRDFSKSARIGELAQGINYQMCFDKLGVYAVYDYKDFIRNVAHINKKIVGQTPDFVLCYKDGTYGILESKGTMAADPTSFLISGNNQVKDGSVFLGSNGIGIRNGYTSAVSFATSSKKMKRNTKIYLADPENSEFPKINIAAKDNIIRECSKYLCLAGNVELANLFKKGLSEITTIRNKLEPRVSIEDYVVGAFEMFLEKDKVSRIEMGLSKRLLEYIMNDKKERMDFEAWSEPNVEYFADGTFIRMV